MMKIIKYSVIILVLVMVTLLVIPFFIDIDDYKATIEHEVEGATGRALHIGHMSASLFPWVGVSLENVTFANRRGFSEQPFIKVASLDVQVELLPLLNQVVTIKQFELKDPEIYLERNAHGAGSWEDLIASDDKGTAPANASKQTAAGEQASGGMPYLAALSAEALRISGGRLSWHDAQNKQDVQISNLALLLDDVQLERPVNVALSLDMGSDSISLEGKVGPVGELAKLNVNKLPVQMHLVSKHIGLATFSGFLPPLPAMLGDMKNAFVSLDGQFEQRPDGVRVTAGSATLTSALLLNADWKIELSSADEARIHAFDVTLDGQHLLKAQGFLKGLSGKQLSYEMRVETDALHRAWLASYVADLGGMYAAHPDPWKSVKMGALLAGDTTSVDIRDMQIYLNDELVQVSGRMGFAGAPDIRLRLAGKTLHLDPWMPQAAEKKAANSTGAAGESDSSATTQAEATEPDLRFLKPWRVNVQAKFDALLMRGLNFTDFTSSIIGQNGVFRLDPARFLLAGGSVEEKASLDASRYPATWTESIHISNLKVGPVLKIVADTDLLDGTMKLDTDIKASGLLPDNATGSLNGTAQLSMTDGRIKGFDIAGAMRNIGSLGQGNGPQYTDFAQLQASFHIRNGVADNRDLFMASPLFRLTGEGIINLVNKSLDYHVKPKLVGSLVGQGDTITSRNGIEIPLHIKGPFTSPSIRPEVNTRSLIDNVGGALKEGAKPKDILKGIGKSLGGGQTDQCNAAPAGNDTKPALPEPAKVLKGLFGM